MHNCFFFRIFASYNYVYTILRTFLPYVASIFVWFALAFSQAQAQTTVDVEWQVVATAGASDTARDATNVPRYLVSWTIGEVFTGTMQGSRRRVTQGFQQYWLNIATSSFPFSVLDHENSGQHFTVFPNPVVEDLTVVWDFEEDLILVFEIYCMLGRRVFYQHQNAKYAELQIKLDRRRNLIPQFHILRISDPARGFLEIHKILKL